MDGAQPSQMCHRSEGAPVSAAAGSGQQLEEAEKMKTECPLPSIALLNHRPVCIGHSVPLVVKVLIGPSRYIKLQDELMEKKYKELTKKLSAQAANELDVVARAAKEAEANRVREKAAKLWARLAKHPGCHK